VVVAFQIGHAIMVLLWSLWYFNGPSRGVCKAMVAILERGRKRE